MSTDFILGIIFLCLALLSATLKKTYFNVPLSELRKRRVLGQEISKEITKTLSYGTALRSLLWLILSLTLAASLTLLAASLPLWFAIVLTAFILYYIFSLLPKTRTSSLDSKLTNLASPGLNWILKRIEKYLNAVYKPLAVRYSSPSSNIFDAQDLLNFLKTLSRRSDHRIEPEVFLALERNLGFNERRVGDLMTPAKRVKTLLESDVIGPILINDLHESSEGYALVRAEPKGDITGLVSISDLSIRSQGSVDGHMRKDVCFVSQDDTLTSVIKAFYETRSTVYVVLNESKKFVGTISLEVVVKQLTGPLDNFTSSETIAKTDD
jgi:CBS domain containing-hemolysin-like protein